MTDHGVVVIVYDGPDWDSFEEILEVLRDELGWRMPEQRPTISAHIKASAEKIIGALSV